MAKENSGRSNTRVAMGYLIGANVEAICIVLVAVYGAEWLNENYAQDSSWLLTTLGVGLVVIIWRWIQMFRNLIRMDRETKEGRS